MAFILRLPIELGPDGALRTLRQDSPDELAQSIRSLVSTVIGERTALPEYGIVDQLGAVSVDESDIAQAIADWEPRIEEPAISEVATALANGAGISTLTVTF